MIIIFIIILIVSLHYIFFLLGIYKGLSKKYNRNEVQRSATVIIPFRNESENILKCLKSVENQNYPKKLYNVIFIDDNSDDDSYNKLLSSINSENIKVLKSPHSKAKSGAKKLAVQHAIENTDNEIIILTDADCVHMPGWIQSMINMFDDETAFISGAVEFNSSKSWFEKFQQLEFSGLIIVGAGLIGRGTPTICNAANLAFKRKVFWEVDGYADNINLSSGDDEFLMQKIRRLTDYKIKFNSDKNALVKTDPNKSIKQFYEQRRRWASKGLHYTNKLLILKLVFIFMFYLGFIVQPILALTINNAFLISLTISFGAKILIEYMVMNKGLKLFHRKLSILVFIFAELLHIPYIIISAIAGTFGGFSWKGRKLRR